MTTCELRPRCTEGAEAEVPRKMSSNNRYPGCGRGDRERSLYLRLRAARGEGPRGGEVGGDLVGAQSGAAGGRPGAQCGKSDQEWGGGGAGQGPAPPPPRGRVPGPPQGGRGRGPPATSSGEASLVGACPPGPPPI